MVWSSGTVGKSIFLGCKRVGNIYSKVSIES